MKVSVSIQTTIVSRHLDVLERMIQFCIDNGVKRVSFLPFIPRGSGNATNAEYNLSPKEKKELRGIIIQKRREYFAQLEIRLLDFTARPIHVVEPDGSIILEGATEGMDKLLYRILRSSNN